MDKRNKNYKGLLIIISSPSGAGKTTICKKISKKDKNINLSISYTTRKKRKSEIEGRHYNFINIKKFNEMKKNKMLLESAKVFGNNYGTPIKNIIKKIDNGKDVIFDIDWQGANQIRKKFPNQIVDFFIMPPSIKELRMRLIKRGQDDLNIVNKRMKMAFKEIKHYDEYKYILVNDNFNKTVKKIIDIIKIERLQKSNLIKIRRNFNKI
ncbi:MAG: Guanylate kinase [Alphaproteobacteria bacterium MarineAlpha5_Bin12]|nr:guanylate kinase [Pelagibacteraceae bacterium]PPR41771.1 MAG: Guanylate kinase [Alphaproteobacteria bacterium MarineAlpha5_Bin12]|tara:strand:+ start:30153 stop:30779 length:627 start_codon:yes stop_codon:yes gene_type:complete